MFWNRADANTRLGATVVLFKGEPVYVHEVRGDGPDDYYAVCVPISGEKKEFSAVLNTDFDLTPVPLGYCNHLANAVYLSRIPKRQWKQGLHGGVLNATLKGKPMPRFDVTSKALVSTIKGIYPNVTKAWGLCDEDKMEECAFSRNFSINKKRMIFYKGTAPVGYFEKGIKTFRLDDEFFFLKEALQECL